jgi:uncharacterized membrane protein YjjB (DUF3815 family)
VGIVELTTSHTLSGLENISRGLLCLALLFAGAWTGVTAAGLLFHVQGVHGVPVDPALTWMFVMVLSTGLCIAFQTPVRDLAWALAACALAYAGFLSGQKVQGDNLGNFLGTVLAIVFANIWSDRTNRPTSIVLLPAFVFMVSGSIGFRGLIAISAGETAVGFQEFAHMFVVAATLAMGLVVGNTVYKPKIRL